MSSPADTSCRQLFAYPELVGELLRLALPPGVQVTGMQRCNGSYVSVGGVQRDMVWRLQRTAQAPLYLLLEFQSRPDHWMALRMHVYAGLLCQDLLRQQRLRSGRLPLLLPLVLYTGHEPWSASTALGALQEAAPAALAPLQPEQNYLLLDQRTMRMVPAPQRSVLSSLLEFERISAEVDLLFALQHIGSWLAGKRNRELRQFVQDWTLQRLRQEFRSLSIPPGITLLEVHAMFHQRFDTPEDLWKYQAEQRGLKQGLEQGVQQGRALGVLAERRRMLARLMARAGCPGWQAPLADSADAQQLEGWIDTLLAGEIPAALK